MNNKHILQINNERDETVYILVTFWGSNPTGEGLEDAMDEYLTSKSLEMYSLEDFFQLLIDREIIKNYESVSHTSWTGEDVDLSEFLSN